MINDTSEGYLFRNLPRIKGYVGKRVHIDPEAYIGANVILLGPVTIEAGVIIEEGTIIGKPHVYQIRNERPVHKSIQDSDQLVDAKPVIDRDCYVGRYSTIHAGTILHQSVICNDYSFIERDSTIGAQSQLMFKAQVYSWVSVGQHCRIGGFCCNDAQLGNFVSMYGSLVHAYRTYGGGRRDPAPKLGDHVVIGWGAVVVGDITIGENTYITAGSTVTKDVPPDTVVTSLNIQCHMDAWLGTLQAFQGSIPKERGSP